MPDRFLVFLHVSPMVSSRLHCTIISKTGNATQYAPIFFYGRTSRGIIRIVVRSTSIIVPVIPLRSMTTGGIPAKLLTSALVVRVRVLILCSLRVLLGGLGRGQRFLYWLGGWWLTRVDRLLRWLLGAFLGAHGRRGRRGLRFSGRGCGLRGLRLS